jgi:hypothetical protein
MYSDGLNFRMSFPAGSGKKDGLITWKGFCRRRRNAPRHGRSCFNEKNVGRIGFTLYGRVGSIDDEIGSTTLALFRGRVGLTDDLTGATTLALFR